MLDASRNMLLNWNIDISGNISVKYNCNISKSKLVFPLPNESYSSLNCFNCLKVIVDLTGVLFWDTLYSTSIYKPCFFGFNCKIQLLQNINIIWYYTEGELNIALYLVPSCTLSTVSTNSALKFFVDITKNSQLSQKAIFQVQKFLASYVRLFVVR